MDKEFFEFMATLMIVVLCVIIFASGIALSIVHFQVKTYNQYHKTDVGFWEWFWCKDYIVGEKHRIEIKND